MKNFLLGITMAGMLSVSAMAADMPPLAKKNGCVACHSIEVKKVGPAWMDVSKKYKGDATAEEKLIAKVSKGGKGVWGNIAMPPQDAAGKKQEDIKQLVEFVLSLDK